jgi:hypothetical protein
MSDPAFGLALGVTIAVVILLYLHHRLMRRVDNLERLTSVSIPSIFGVFQPLPASKGEWTTSEMTVTTPMTPRQITRRKNKANRQKHFGGNHA